MTDPIYAIGDIHGQLAELQRVLALIEAEDGPAAHIVFLGDYTDRGPDTTLAAYGLDFSGRSRQLDVHEQALTTVPQTHVDLLNTLEPYFETDDLFFAHAGIRPGVPLDQQDIEDLLWIRKDFHIVRYAHPKLIVHGHTPVDRAQHYGNRINLDSGAGYGKPLTAAVFEGSQCWTLTAKGRFPLTP